MQCNHSSLQDVIYLEKIDLLFLSETWLTRNDFDAAILPPDYDVFRTDCNGKTGGGVLIAAKKESFIETKQIFVKQNADLEIVCVECTLKRTRILVVCCYRPPNSSSSWLLSFKEFLDSISDLYDEIIITGDSNFPKISWSENWYCHLVKLREFSTMHYLTIVSVN